MPISGRYSVISRPKSCQSGVRYSFRPCIIESTVKVTNARPIKHYIRLSFRGVRTSLMLYIIILSCCYNVGLILLCHLPYLTVLILAGYRHYIDRQYIDLLLVLYRHAFSRLLAGNRRDTGPILGLEVFRPAIGPIYRSELFCLFPLH